ncbi:MAG TPA: ATP-dependent DNA helicase [Microlunatus sp.]|nr:ATP-dependent DNA helicase [Microlunatus sp.]
MTASGPGEEAPRPTADQQTAAVLAAAVAEIGGHERAGQLQLAAAVGDAFDTGVHLLAQAGTGTGKSLGYLAPTLVRLARGDLDRVVVTTATLALQSQLASKDIPSALDAVESVTGRRPSHAILKGRTNYACLLKVRDGADDQAALIPASELVASLQDAPRAAPESALGAEVLALREWAEEQVDHGGLADRDDAPSHTDRGWQQVSIPVRECLGTQQCPQGGLCFVEKSREEARAADLVVTNHALLAIDAMHGGTALPEHQAVVIDEAHELTARVTGAASAELSPGMVERVGKRALSWLDDDDLGAEMLTCADTLRDALEEVPLERVEDPGSPFVAACETVRSVTRRVVSALTNGGDKNEPDCRQAAAAVKEVFDIAERMAALSEHDVVWVADRERSGREARVAPLTVAGLMRTRVFGEHTTVLTSATLKLGGDFAGVAGSVGLREEDRVPDGDPGPVRGDEDEREPWRGIDVGSPFAYDKQGILYLARRMPVPGRDGITEAVLAEVAELVWAAGGRTLGLFSSRRAAETAAVWVRKQLPKQTVLCQGDAQLSELTRRFVAEEETSLFGTLSLWQGIDVPGSTCRLVIIDRIPFPRPDEPLTVARQRAVTDAGGNGFMSVAASHAALLLAQGSGRLIRRIDDRGVVAVLDPRLVTARYSSYLRASMPPMWTTSDRETAIGALRRLAESD